jgi:hypothetical protein
MRLARRSPTVGASFLLAATIGTTLVGACAPDRTSDAARLDRLLVLAGDPGATTLRSWTAGAQVDDGHELAAPDDTTWVAAGAAELVAGRIDGTLRTSDSMDPDVDREWIEVTAKGADGLAVDGPFFFPSWDPEGGRFAALAGDLDTAPRLTLVDPTVKSGLEIDLGEAVMAAPPVWVGPDLVAVAVGPESSPGSILVDTTTGDTTPGPAGGRLMATAADGRTIAIAGAERGPVVIRETDAWRGNDGSSIGSVDPPDGVVAAIALALDASGTRLAIAWLEDGGTVRIAVHDKTAGWRRVAAPGVGDAAGAVVAWLR